MTIKIVTDSTSDIPEHLVKKLDITIVPVSINVGGNSYLDGVEMLRHEFYTQWNSFPQHPTTAAPAVSAFVAAYRRLANEGATQIVSIHIGDKLSSTGNVARLAAAEVPDVSVLVLNSGQITLGMGLQVMVAAELAAQGASLMKVTQLVRNMQPRVRVFGMIDTLEALRRGGRVNWAQFGIGTLLQVKPIMMIYDGEITVEARVRTRKRAVPKLLELVGQFSPFETLAVLHANAPEAAALLRQQAAHLFPKEQEPITMELTPALGTHLGPKAVGFACVSQ